MSVGHNPSNAGPGRTVSWTAAFLLLVGLVARLAPFANQGGRLLRRFPTEDGYLMLTIARNLALGRGMSTADGTMPTNGTQPLATFLWSACSLAVGGDKEATVAVVLVLQVALGTATAYVIYLLALRILHETEAPREKALLAAAGWYASETVVAHTMNCLESGLYVLLLSLVLLVVFRATGTASAPRYAQWALSGVLLGLGFWGRNDVVLFCAALAGAHLFWGLPGAPARTLHRFLELAVAGAIVAAIAAPWLTFNYTRFGHVVPISGQAEALDAAFGANAGQVGRGLFAYETLFLPIPNALSNVPWVQVASTVAVGLYAWFVWSFVRRSESLASRQACLVAAFATVLFAGFYGMFFGAPHFMSRYLFALSPLYATAWGAAIHLAWRRLDRASPLLVPVAALALAGLAVVLNVRAYRLGGRHPHFQVVDWLRTHALESNWVGAPQSGTVGYFHDRTINLDGKVNPGALAARKRHGVAQYVVDSEIEYVADWEAIAADVPLPGVTLTMGDPPMGQYFEVLVDDKESNLAILKRKPR